MKILILTGRFGMGHNSAAQAVKEMILSSEPSANIDIIDIIDYIFPKSSKVIYGCFNFMVSKFSGLYNFFNKFTARRTSMPLKKSVVKKIDLLLKKYDTDMVISTFPACSQYISAYKKSKNCDIPLYTYITDISANEEWISEKTDMYFVGSENTKNLLLSKGVKEEKIVISGIPTKQKFKEEKLVNIEENKKEVLIMGGGLGLVPYYDNLLSKLSNMNDINVTFITGKNKKLLDKIKKEYPKIKALGYTDKVDDYMKKSDLSNMNDINVTFITGKNKKLLDKIKKEYPKIKALGYTDKVDDYMKKSDLVITKPGGITLLGKNKKLLDKIKKEYPKIKALGYTDKVDDYMKKSDLVITKPGGITLFEAIHTNTPLYIIRPFLHQEIENARFIQEQNIGKVVWTNGTDICEDVTSLLKNEILLDYMEKNMKDISGKLETLSPLVYYNKKEVELCF